MKTDNFEINWDNFAWLEEEEEFTPMSDEEIEMQINDGASIRFQGKLDGYDFTIRYRADMSNSDYTAHKCYSVETTADSDTAHRIVKKFFNDGSWTEKHHREMYEKEPTMANAFHTYHTWGCNEKCGLFYYTHVRPYDD